MSFQWDAIDEREKAKRTQDRELKDYLKNQFEESKQRKQRDKLNDLENMRKLNHNLFQDNNNNMNQRIPNSNAKAIEFNHRNNQQAFVSQNQNQNSAPSNDYISKSQYNLHSKEPPQTISNILNIQDSHKPDFNPNDDILVKLRSNEEQLIQDRRARNWLEADVNSGKNLLATMSAKVDKLSETVSLDNNSIRELMRMIGDTDKRSKEIIQTLILKFEKDAMKLHQVIADIVSKQRSEDRARQEQEERFRSVMEDLNAMRYKLEAYTLKTNEVGNEVNARARDLDIEFQRGADTLRAIKEHDHAIDSIRNTIGSTEDLIQKKVELISNEIRHRLETENRSRNQFEQNIRNLTIDIRKAMQSQEKDSIDRTESLKSAFLHQADRERMERDRIITSIVDQMKVLDKVLKESPIQLSDRFSEQFSVIESQLNDERNIRKKFETDCRNDLEDGLRLVQQLSMKKSDEIQLQLTDIKYTSNLASKGLQESIILVEKAFEQKIRGVEEVLRAEIKARMDTEQQLISTVTELTQKNELMEKKMQEKIEDLVSTLRESEEKQRQDLKNTADQLNASKARSIDDLESQLLLQTNRLKQVEADLNLKIQNLTFENLQVTQKLDEILQTNEEKISEAILSLKNEDNDTLRKILGVELLCNNMKIDIDERFNLKTVQIDQTMEAFKTELTERITTDEANENKKELEAILSIIQNKLNTTAEQVAEISDSIQDRATRTEIDNLELNLKSLISSVQSKMVLLDELIINNSSELADRARKNELHESERKMRELITELKIHNEEIVNSIQTVKEEISNRIMKSNLLETEERLKTHIHNVENQINDFYVSQSLLKESISIKLSKQEFETFESQSTETIQNMTQKIDDTIQDIARAKEEITEKTIHQLKNVTKDLDENINLLETKMGSFEENIKSLNSSMAENNTQTLEKINQFDQSIKKSQENQSNLIEKIKEMNIETFEDLNLKFNEIPDKITQLRTEQQELKQWMMETAQVEGEATAKSLMNIHQEVDQKISETKFNQMNSEMYSSIQKLQSRYEIEELTVQNLVSKIEDNEKAFKEKFRDIQNVSERNLKEQSLITRQFRESTLKKFDDIEYKSSQIPKMIDSLTFEIKRLKNDIDDRVNVEIRKVEREIINIKSAIQLRITDKMLENSISDAIRPLDNRIDRISLDLQDIRLSKERDAKYENQRKTENISPTIVPGNFYKPSHLDFRNSPTGKLPNQDEPTVDPRLESLADEY